MPEPNDRLQSARARAGFQSASDAARHFGWNENTYRSHENGERGLRSSVAKRYAAAFKINLLWLLTGEGGDSTARHIPVIASITEAGVVNFSKNRKKALGTICVGFAPEEGAFAYIIDTNELGERYVHGDLLVCWPPNRSPEECVTLSSCIINVLENIWLLREIIFRPDEQDLILFDPTPGRRMPMTQPASAVAHVQPVRAIVPLGQYDDVTGEHTLSDWLSRQLKDEMP